MSKQKAVIRLGVPNDKNRSKAMQLASQCVGVNSVAIAGASKDQLEVVGEGIDITCLINSLRKRIYRADIVSVEEVKDKAKAEEEKKKKEAEEKKKKEEEERKAAEEALKKLWGTYPPPCYGGGPPPTYLCEEQPAGCHVM